MPDITMCKDKDCPQKDTCYRFKAEAKEHRQSYFLNTPRDKNTNECNYYWPIKKEQS